MVLSGFEASPTPPIPHDAKALVAPDDEELLSSSGPYSNPSHRMVMGLAQQITTNPKKAFQRGFGIPESETGSFLCAQFFPLSVVGVTAVG